MGYGSMFGHSYDLQKLVKDSITLLRPADQITPLSLNTLSCHYTSIINYLATVIIKYLVTVFIKYLATVLNTYLVTVTIV